MPTHQQKQSFSDVIRNYIDQEVNGFFLSDDCLYAAIVWFKDNLEPEDIFSEKQLSNWAEANGYIKE